MPDNALRGRPASSAPTSSSKAALNVYQQLRASGTQQSVVDTMQTRAELYEHLGYHAYEQKLDALFTKDAK